MVRVRSVRCLDAFVVELGFTDGTSRVLDLDPYLRGPVFEPLRADTEAFRSVNVDPVLGTLVWPNGADIDPDVLRWGRRPAAWGDPPTPCQSPAHGREPPR